VQAIDEGLKAGSEPRNMTVIRTQSLTKRFGLRVAVNNAGFEVERGDVFGLLGPNGAGKTTIIRMLLGLVKPTSGTAQVFGYDTVAQKSEVLARVSAIVEAPALYPGMNGYDNLKAMAIAVGIENPGRKIDEVLGRMGLAGRARDKFSTYSLGMKQRLCIASALLTDPQLLILDEPTNGLDPAGMVEIRTLIRGLSEQGVTVLLSSHLLNEVQQVCNRVAIIQMGQIIQQGLVEELLAGKTSVHVKVRPDEWEKAWYILQGAGLAPRLRAEGEYLIIAGPTEDGAVINHALATNGIFASEISPRSQSLEEYYLSLTNYQMPAPGYYYPQPPMLQPTYPVYPAINQPGGNPNGN